MTRSVTYSDVGLGGAAVGVAQLVRDEDHGQHDGGHAEHHGHIDCRQGAERKPSSVKT